MKSLFLLVFCSILGLSAAMAEGAQKGMIKGQVTEKSDQGSTVAVPFANVYVAGTTVGVTTDMDGNYTLSLQPGKYTIVVSFIGLIPDTSYIEVESSDQVIHNVRLFNNAQVLEAFDVVAKADKESENFLLMSQRESSTINQSIGAKELSQKGASDVAEGLTKVAGISKASNANVFVRGMGDRYNNALLNGMPVPSPNPDLKVIPLDIFPTSVVSNLSIDKTFTSDLYGDFAGGTINITTKDYPEDKVFKMGIGTNLNTMTTGQTFYQAHGGSLQYLGYDDGTRDLPESISKGRSQSTIFDDSGDSESPFTNRLNDTQRKGGIPVNLSLQYGDYKKLSGQKELGFLITANHGNGFQYTNGRYAIPDNTGTRTLTDYQFDKYAYTTNSAALGNFYLRLNKRNKINFNTLYVHDSKDEVAHYDANMADWDREVFLFVTRNTYRENLMISNQLLGEHELSNSWTLNWGLAYSAAFNKEPDTKQLLYKAMDDDKTAYTIEGLNASDNLRFFSYLDEREISSKVQFEYRFGTYTNAIGAEKPKGKLQFGVNTRYKNRTFYWRQINMNIDALENELVDNGIAVDPLNPERVYNEENYSRGLYHYKEQIDGSRIHYMNVPIVAPFVQSEYNFSKKFSIIAGFRVEQSTQNIRYKKIGDRLRGPFTEINYGSIIPMPNLSARYRLNELSNLRFAASQTISRPNLKELAPFQYRDVFGGTLVEGNPALINGINYNADLKYERFPNGGELLAISIFGKYLENPIERAQIPSSGILYSFFNMGTAVVAGVELEYKKNLGNLISQRESEIDEKRFIDRIDIGFNASLLYSQIMLGENASELETNKGTILATNLNRPMYGASPYLVNADISYNLEIGQVESKISAIYNVFGRRLYAAGTLGAGDVYELPVNSLDVIVRNKISDRLNVNLSVKNLLNPEIKVIQEFAGEPDFELNAYRRGRFVGLSLTYDLISR